MSGDAEKLSSGKDLGGLEEQASPLSGPCPKKSECATLDLQPTAENDSAPEGAHAKVSIKNSIKNIYGGQIGGIKNNATTIFSGGKSDQNFDKKDSAIRGQDERLMGPSKPIDSIDAMSVGLGGGFNTQDWAKGNMKEEINKYVDSGMSKVSHEDAKLKQGGLVRDLERGKKHEPLEKALKDINSLEDLLKNSSKNSLHRDKLGVKSKENLSKGSSHSALEKNPKS